LNTEPSPSNTRGYKRSSRRGKAITLPALATGSPCLLVETSVRRSSRLNRNDGFCQVRLEREPTKKRKISVVKIDEHLGSLGPVPIEILHGWGIYCGVDPSDLSPEALMQTPSQNGIYIEDADVEVL
jgi:hypothetical protein